MSKNPYLSVRIFTLLLLSSTATAEIVNIQFSSTNSDLPRCLSLPSIINISRYVSGFRNTACGHNDFCSVRLNGPI